MNTSATLAHLQNRYANAYFNATRYHADPSVTAHHSALAQRLNRAMNYLRGRQYCRACGNPDCPKVRATLRNPYWRECPARHRD